MFDNITAILRHETITGANGRRVTRYANGAVFFHWRRAQPKAIYVSQIRRWQSDGDPGPWNWQLMPAPPVAKVSMINTDYQQGGLYELRAAERPNSRGRPDWQYAQVFFPDSMATLSSRDGGADEKNAAYDLNAVNPNKQAETAARAPEELLKIYRNQGP